MAKTRICGCGCGTSLEGTDSRRRYLNDTHRKQVARGTAPGARQKPTGPVSTEIADMYRRELEDLGVLETGEAQIVLGMCVQLDEKIVQGAAYVSLSKEVDRRVDKLRLKAVRSNDPSLSILARVEEKQQSHLRAV